MLYRYAAVFSAFTAPEAATFLPRRVFHWLLLLFLSIETTDSSAAGDYEGIYFGKKFGPNRNGRISD
jgi:hypothetical protein